MAQVKSYRNERERELEAMLFGGMKDLCASITKAAKQNATAVPPGHPQVQTGTLRRSITLDVEKKKEGIEGKVGIMSGKEQGDEALKYAPFVELGTRYHPPYPYLLPAAESHKGRVKEFFE